MALVRAGFRLDAFFEAAEPAIYPGLGDAARRIPAVYVIKASKTADAPKTPDASKASNPG